MAEADNMVSMRSRPGDERESAIQRGWTVEGRGTSTEPEPSVEPQNEDVAEDSASDIETDALSGGEVVAKPAQMSNLTVVLLGVVGGISMLYAWVWMSWAQYYSIVNTSVAASSGSIGGILQQVVFWIAPLAPILWFVAALVMQRRNQRRLAMALVLGLIVTFPLPMVLSSGAAL